jgi:hypothetical protein
MCMCVRHRELVVNALIYAAPMSLAGFNEGSPPYCATDQQSSTLSLRDSPMPGSPNALTSALLLN